MSIDKKILEEITRFRKINNYILEQDVPPPDPALAGAPPADPALAGAPPPDPALAGAPPADPAAAGGAPPPPAPIDVETDKDVEEVDDDEKENEEKLEVTDLVNTQKNIEKKQEDYFNNLFAQLKSL